MTRIGCSVPVVHRSTLFNSFQQCIVYSQPLECSSKLNDQPVREQVTASTLIIHMFLQLTAFIWTDIFTLSILCTTFRWFLIGAMCTLQN